MQLRDNTVEANSGEDMADYYLYHVQSADDRWAIAVEQVTGARYHISVLVSEEGWGVFGALRYWSFTDRALAEARYLELQRLLGALPDDATLKQVIACLPPAERGGPSAEAEA